MTIRSAKLRRDGRYAVVIAFSHGTSLTKIMDSSRLEDLRRQVEDQRREDEAYRASVRANNQPALST